MMTPHYGIVVDRFWSGPTGAAIREQGGQAGQLVALHLMTCEYANMLGLYFLPPERILGDTGLTRRTLAGALSVLAATDFAVYDARTQYVWVKQMVLYRIPLKAGVARLEKADNRAIAAARLYAKLGDNPFLGPFFDRWGARLRLVGRRRGSTPKMSPFSGSGNGVRTPLEARDQRSEIRDQGSEIRKSTGARAPRFPLPDDPTHGQLCVVVQEVLNDDPGGTYVDHIEAIKFRCARLQLVYAGDGIRKAYDAVEHAARKPRA